MAGQQMGMRPRLRSNLIQNTNFQAQNPIQTNPLGINGTNGVDGINGTKNAQDPVIAKLEELLKQFMEALKSKEEAAQGGAPPAGGGAPAGGAQKTEGGANDPLFTLEELLKQLRELAKKNPEAVQQFLQQNPQLAQMLGGQIDQIAGAGDVGGMPQIDGGGPII